MNGLTGQPVHTGSWGLPDFGITEAIAGAFGQGMNQQGGSQLRQGTVYNVGNVPMYQGYTPRQQQIIATGKNPASPAALGASTQNTTNTQNTGNNLNLNGKNVGDIFGINGRQARVVDPGKGLWEYLNTPGNGPSGPSQIDVDNAFGDAQNAYNDWKGQWMNPTTQQNFLNQYTAPFDALKPDLQNAYNQGMNLAGNQQQQVNTQQQSAIDAARNMFNEVTQGNRQRFGGSSSAGEFANAFQNRALQQQVGQAMNTGAQGTQNVQQRMSDLKSQFDTGMQKIDAQKATALTQAQNALQQRLDAINQSGVQLGADKAQAKLQELQNYRSLIASINSQAEAAAQQLNQSVLSIAGQLASSNSYLSAYGKQPVDIGQQMAPIFQMVGGGQMGGQGISNVYGGYNPYQRYDYNGQPV